MEQNNITLLGVDYLVLDVVDVAIVDSFVQKNKIGSGNGEARLYLGSQRFGWDSFFDNFQNANAFFLKQHLITYLEDAKFEYENQEQVYQNDISKSWKTYLTELNKLNELEKFEIKKANGPKDPNRYYIRSNSNIYKLFRKIALPVITSLSILKLQTLDDQIVYLFRPFINYFEDTRDIKEILKAQEEIKTNEDLTNTEKNKELDENKELLQARQGQGKYRTSLINEMRECLVTGVNDERMLIASHIKPWRSANDEEKIDKYNGLLLTPTFDRLFDQGFITFSDDGKIFVSPYLSPMNIRRLSLIPNKKCDLIYNKKRCEYLEFHRDNIFKKG
jgi:putative restriction endonuclease